MKYFIVFLIFSFGIQKCSIEHCSTCAVTDTNSNSLKCVRCEDGYTFETIQILGQEKGKKCIKQITFSSIPLGYIVVGITMVVLAVYYLLRKKKAKKNGVYNSKSIQEPSTLISEVSRFAAVRDDRDDECTGNVIISQQTAVPEQFERQSQPILQDSNTEIKGYKEYNGDNFESQKMEVRRSPSSHSSSNNPYQSPLKINTNFHGKPRGTQSTGKKSKLEDETHILPISSKLEFRESSELTNGPKNEITAEKPVDDYEREDVEEPEQVVEHTQEDIEDDYEKEDTGNTKFEFKLKIVKTPTKEEEVQKKTTKPKNSPQLPETTPSLNPKVQINQEITIEQETKGKTVDKKDQLALAVTNIQTNSDSNVNSGNIIHSLSPEADDGYPPKDTHIQIPNILKNENNFKEQNTLELGKPKVIFPAKAEISLEETKEQVTEPKATLPYASITLKLKNKDSKSFKESETLNSQTFIETSKDKKKTVITIKKKENQKTPNINLKGAPGTRRKRKVNNKSISFPTKEKNGLQITLKQNSKKKLQVNTREGQNTIKLKGKNRVSTKTGNLKGKLTKKQREKQNSKKGRLTHSRTYSNVLHKESEYESKTGKLIVKHGQKGGSHTLKKKKKTVATKNTKGGKYQKKRHRSQQFDLYEPKSKQL